MRQREIEFVENLEIWIDRDNIPTSYGSGVPIYLENGAGHSERPSRTAVKFQLKEVKDEGKV